MEYSFIVSPMKNQIDLKSGETYEGYILVSNPQTATADFHYQVSVYPYSVSGDDYEMDFTTVSDWSRIAEWIKIKNPTGVLKPNETNRIYYTITVPENAPAGGQYAALGVASAADESGGIAEVIEMESIIYANVEGETIHEGEITKNSIPSFVTGGIPATTVTLVNRSNIHESAITKISVKNLLTGESVSMAEGTNGEFESLIMPDSIRSISRNIDNLSSLGIYEVSQEVSFLGQASSISTVMVLCPIWFIVLVVCTVVAILSLIIHKVHKNRQKSPKPPKKQLQNETDNAKIEA